MVPLLFNVEDVVYVVSKKNFNLNIFFLLFLSESIVRISLQKTIIFYHKLSGYFLKNMKLLFLR